MKVKVDVHDLKPGMYISELDRPWLETPFLFQGFELREDKELDVLKKHCAYVYVDVQRSPGFTPHYFQATDMPRSRALQEKQKEIDRAVDKIAQQPDEKVPRKPYHDTTTLEEEIVHAKKIERDARNLMRETLENVQQGKKFDMEGAKKLIGVMTESIVRNPDALMCLSQLKEVSEYTALHSVRCTIIALAFGRHLALGREEMAALGLGALTHDIGMVKIPKEILDKPTGLTEEEFAMMRKHVNWGLEILQANGGVVQGAADMVAMHHERGEGHGYPRQLTAKTMTPPGLLAAIVDVYDAVTSDRHYGVALSAEDALKRMYEWRAKDFEPKLVEEFIRCMGIFPIGSLVELSSGSIGVVITINRARRLKPKVALVLTATRAPYSTRIITDLMEHKDAQGQEIKITRVLPSGSFGINPMDYLVRL